MAKKQRNKKIPGAPGRFGIAFWLGAIFWLLFAAGAGYLGLRAYRSDLFRIRDIKSNMAIDADLLRGVKGGSLFVFNARALQKKIMAANSDFKDVVVYKDFPSRVLIKIIRREPYVQLKYNGYFTIDKEGVVIDSDPAQVENLLSVEITDCPDAPVKGARIISPQLRLAVSLINELLRRKFIQRYPIESINTSSARSTYFMLRTGDPAAGPVQVIIGDENFGRRLFIFDNLMATRIKGDLGMVKYIDLRYKKAYIGYKR